MKLSIITILMGAFLSFSVSPKDYVDAKFELTNFKEKVDEVVLLQDIVYQQMTLSSKLQEAAMEQISDTLAVYGQISEVVAYQASLAINEKRKSVIKQHKRHFRRLTHEQKIARADSIINGTYEPNGRFVQSKLVVAYEHNKGMQRSRLRKGVTAR